MPALEKASDYHTRNTEGLIPNGLRVGHGDCICCKKFFRTWDGYTGYFPNKNPAIKGLRFFVCQECADS